MVHCCLCQKVDFASAFPISFKPYKPRLDPVTGYCLEWGSAYSHYNIKSHAIKSVLKGVYFQGNVSPSINSSLGYQSVTQQVFLALFNMNYETLSYR